MTLVAVSEEQKKAKARGGSRWQPDDEAERKRRVLCGR